MNNNSLFDKTRGQRMLLTKYSRIYEEAEDELTKENAARKIAEVISWADSVGYAISDFIEDRNLPARAFEIHSAPDGVSSDIDESEVQQAEKEINASIETSSTMYLGEGNGNVYVYDYPSLPGRAKIGRTDSDVIARIARQINESTPDRPRLLVVIKTEHARALENALHGALELRGRRTHGGGKEWFQVTAEEIITVYKSIIGHDI